MTSCGKCSRHEATTSAWRPIPKRGYGSVALADRLSALHPLLKVIYTSGHPRESVRDSVGLAEDAVFLQKPFSLAKLEQKVAEVLD